MLLRTGFGLAAAVALAGAQGTAPGFPAGWNGNGLTPGMWYQHHGNCMISGAVVVDGDESGAGNCSAGSAMVGRRCSTCAAWKDAIDAIAAKTWTRVGAVGEAAAFSLADAG